MLSTYLLRDASHIPNFIDRAITLENVYLSSSVRPSLPRTIRPSWRWLCFLKHSGLHCYWDPHKDVHLCKRCACTVQKSKLSNRLITQNRVLLSSMAYLLIKKFLVFYAPCRFIKMFTPAQHLSIFNARWSQSMLYHPTLKIHFNIILPMTPRSSKWPGIWLILSLSLTHIHTHTEVPGGQDFDLLWPVLTKHSDTMWLQLGFPNSAATAQITFSSVKLHPSLSELGCCWNLCSCGIVHPLKMGGQVDRWPTTSVTTILLRATSQKNKDLIYTAVEAWNCM